FTVVLTGQDGFSPDQARGFAPTPQSFQFGVCAMPSLDAHCTFDPNAVPKAVDVITPAGVLQSNELDYTLHAPVSLTGVTIPWLEARPVRVQPPDGLRRASSRSADQVEDEVELGSGRIAVLQVHLAA